MLRTRNPETVMKLLNGVICVYKPLDMSLRHVCAIIKTNLSKELSELGSRTRTPQVLIEGDSNKKLSVQVKESYSDHPLVLGPQYEQNDIKCHPSLPLDMSSSGVALIGINDGTRLSNFLATHYRTRAYRVKGRLGIATDNFFKNGKYMERTTLRHIHRFKLDRLLANIQSSHQKKKFELWGVDIQSQTAYDLAVSGHIQPDSKEVPLIYGIKCVEFESPYFTLEVHAVNEYDKYLHTLIHDIGVQLKSSAHCVSVQCIRQNFLTVENALLKKHWTLQHILDNVLENNKIYSNVLKEMKETRKQLAISSL